MIKDIVVRGIRGLARGNGSMKLRLLVVTLILLVPSALAFSLSMQKEADLLEQGHYNEVFDASQMQAEFLRLDAELGRYIHHPGPDEADEVDLRFEIVMNHVGVMKNGLMGEALDSASPGLSATLDTVMARVQPRLTHLDGVETAEEALALLTPLESAMAQAAALVSAKASEAITDTGEALRSARNLLLTLTSALLVAAVSLAMVLWRQHADMRRMAYRDTLTGLPNRRAFNEVIDQHCGLHQLAVFLVDVDNFKDVNDRFGHDVGDALLRQMASRLIAAFPEARIIARLGGDEFAVLMRTTLAKAELAAVAERACAAGAEPFEIGDRLLRSGVSIGVVVDVAEDRDPVGLLKRADLALYAAKAAGRGRPFLFEPALERDFQAHRDLEEDLRAAIASDGIEVHFQPVIDFETGRPSLCEALARWSHPQHGNVSPARFIPLAEQSGLIVALGRRVLARACRDALTWPASVRVAVNVSSRQITEPDFGDQVAQILAETGLAPHRLELEITESVLLHMDDALLETILRLKRIGVSFALDDFGTGYSSLGRLHRLPLDKLKIDQSFIRALEGSEGALGIVETIIDLARKLGLAVTAEGIETETQHTMLLRAGCDQGQGYLYAKPLPAAACRRALDAAPPHGIAPPSFRRMAVLARTA